MSFKLNKYERYIFATDLDGTFLTEMVSSLHIDSFEMVEKIKEAGHHFVITTGRSWWWAKTLYEQLNLVDASIHFSGAIVHHPLNTDFKEFRTSISQIVLKDFINKVDIWSFADRVSAVGRKHHATFSKGDDLNKLFFNCYEYIIQWPVDKMSKEEFIELVSKNIGDGYVVRVWNLFGDVDNYCGIISPQNTDKSLALEKVAEYYDVPRTNVIYFGDNINDIGALQWSGHSYAVSNAKEDAKESADEILDLSCDQGAVPKKIIELIKEQENENN